jgi:hypothetical protein
VVGRTPVRRSVAVTVVLIRSGRVASRRVETGREQTMEIRTFSASSTRRLDQKVNDFVSRPDVEVRRLHAAMSFGTHMVVVEYDPRRPDERWDR